MSLDSVVWLAALIALLVIEGATANLVTIWFAAGAAAALVLSLFFNNMLVQLLVFTLVSLAALVLTKPLVHKLRNQRMTPTNADRNLGRTATVLEAIGPDAPGRVRLDGVDWRACVRSGETLHPGDRCRVIDIQSTVLIVEPQPEPAVL